jgi:hypothetical protein
MSNREASKGVLAPLEQLAHALELQEQSAQNVVTLAGKNRQFFAGKAAGIRQALESVRLLAALPGLGGPQEPTKAEDLARVAPLKAGDDRQDLPRRGD